MAVPGAVQRRAEQEAASLRAAGIDPNSGQPIAVQAAEAPVAPAAAPTFTFSQPEAAPPAADPRDAEIERLKAQLSTQDGRTSTSATELANATRLLETQEANRRFLTQTIEEQNAEMAKLTERLAEAESTRTTSGVASVLKDLENTAAITPEEERDFGESRAFIQKVVRQAMQAAIKPIADQLNSIQGSLGRLKGLDKLPALEEGVRTAHADMQRAKQQTFYNAQILKFFPDFDEIKKSPEWQAYVQSDVPGRGIKVGMLLKSYDSLGDATSIRAVLQNFYDKRQARPSLSNLAVPAKTTGDVPSTPTPTKMLASEYKKNLNDLRMKRMSKEDWEAYKVRWEAAMLSGNVEMDVELR